MGQKFKNSFPVFVQSQPRQGNLETLLDFIQHGHNIHTSWAWWQHVCTGIH